MNEERFFYISLYISKEKLLHYFPEKLGNTHLSGYFAKFWFNQFPTAVSNTDDDFNKWIIRIISKVGVPRFLSNYQNHLREYYDYDILFNYSPELLFLSAKPFTFKMQESWIEASFFD